MLLFFYLRSIIKLYNY